MKEYLKVRASRLLNQDELVDFLKTRFPESVKLVGGLMPKGMETVEVSVPLSSPKVEEIRDLITTRRKHGAREYSYLPICKYVRKYTGAELRAAEIFSLRIRPHFEPAGEECGTIYETLCHHCNLGQQLSDLILDLRHVPRSKDIAETIAWVEWVVSSKFVHAFAEKGLSGAEFRPIFEFRNPMKSSRDWCQLQIIGRVGAIAEETLLGRDPFSPSKIKWRCPLGHSVVAQILSEVYLKRDAWDGSDIAVTSSLLGQGRNLLRPTPLILISQRMFRALQDARLKGYSVEVAHFI